MKYYATGDDFGGYDSMEEAVADLKHLVNQFKAEGVAEGDNLATFEEAQCNHTKAGEHCPEHGLEECGNYGMYESELARLKSLALLK